MSRMTPRLVAVAAACAAAAALPAAAQAFNPQPDPPGVVRVGTGFIPPDPYHAASPAQSAGR